MAHGADVASGTSNDFRTCGGHVAHGADVACGTRTDATQHEDHLTEPRKPTRHAGGAQVTRTGSRGHASPCGCPGGTTWQRG